MENKIIIALAIMAGGAGIYYFLRNKQRATIDYTTGDFGLPRLGIDPQQMKKAAASGNLRLAQGSDLLRFRNVA
ncbi:hypothetical protein DRH13_00150 [Candidatus Woesebacteria bacterium]|nr:MAG: hypothetical protein DRH13_00150 [Candidatus Woesebacteria bacterium]